MNYEWKEHKKVPKKLIDLIQNITACKRACEKLTQEVVKHYEKSDIAEREFWTALEAEFELDLSKVTYKLENGKIYSRPKIQREIENLVNDMEFSKAIRETIGKILQGEKKP